MRPDGSQQDLRAQESQLRQWVEVLAGEIGDRHARRYQQLEAAARFVEAQLALAGLLPERQTYVVDRRPCHNIEAVVKGRSDGDALIVAAHYDAERCRPWSKEAAASIAALLGLAAEVARWRPERDVRFVAFVGDEAPRGLASRTGSTAYARSLRERGLGARLILTLEAIGCDASRPEGVRLAFIGNSASWRTARSLSRTFESATGLTARWLPVPGFAPLVRTTDQSAFWREGFLGVMATDLGPLIAPHFPAALDLPRKLDYACLAAKVGGLDKALTSLARA